MNSLMRDFVDVLRSPITEDHRYEFYQGGLRSSTGCKYCAGGILCDLAINKVPEKFCWGNDLNGYWTFRQHGDEYESHNYVPESVYMMLGFNSREIPVNKEILSIMYKYHSVLQPDSMSFTIEKLNDFLISWGDIASILEIASGHEGWDLDNE